MPDWGQWLQLGDPLVRKIVYGALALVAVVFVWRIFSRVGERRRLAQRRSELQRSYETVRLQQEEVRRLAERIDATSSTSRIAGYAILRQIETVFGEPRASSAAAVDLAKALAAQKGANALINLQSQQTPNGKWQASGDAVVVKVIGRPPPPAKPTPPEHPALPG